MPRFQNMPASWFPVGVKTPTGYIVEGSVLVDTATKAVLGPHLDDNVLGALNALADSIDAKASPTPDPR